MIQAQKIFNLRQSWQFIIKLRSVRVPKTWPIHNRSTPIDSPIFPYNFFSHKSPFLNSANIRNSGHHQNVLEGLFRATLFESFEVDVYQIVVEFPLPGAGIVLGGWFRRSWVVNWCGGFDSETSGFENGRGNRNNGYGGFEGYGKRW